MIKASGARIGGSWTKNGATGPKIGGSVTMIEASEFMIGASKVRIRGFGPISEYQGIWS